MTTQFWPGASFLRSQFRGDLGEYLVDALGYVQSALQGRDVYAWDDMAWIDPPPIQELTWRERYATELDDHIAYGFAFDTTNPLGAIFRRARLLSDERDAIRSHYHGASLSSIARQMGRQKRTVQGLIDRGEDRLLRLAGKPSRSSSDEEVPLVS